MDVTLLDASSAHWGAELERIGVVLNAGRNSTLFPFHFLYVTLSKIGGKIAHFRDGAQEVGVGFLFPRHSPSHQTVANPTQGRAYTLRWHSLMPPETPVDTTRLTSLCSADLGGAPVVFYDPTAPHTFDPSHEQIGPVDLGRPDAAEALALPKLQQQVWGNPPELLYPADIHCREFAAGTSLVARVERKLAGFLFGFYKFGGSPLPPEWLDYGHAPPGPDSSGPDSSGPDSSGPDSSGPDIRLESQTMAVLPEYRGLRIASLLKRAQAQAALGEGIRIVNWTADPLQFPNAALNFGLLRAVCCEFAADLYPFRNDLNRVHASRFSLTWLVASHHVAEAPPLTARAELVDLRHRPRIPRANDGPAHADLSLTADIIAIEVPADWTALQQQDIAQAQAWRRLTDELFTHYIGLGKGQYAVTGVGTDGDRRYLLAERGTAALWRRLGRVE